MSGSEPAGAALKRKRITTSGNGTVTSTAYSAIPSPSIALPEKWIQAVGALPATAVTPPPAVLKAFLGLYSDGLRDFKSGLECLQKAQTSERKFEVAASNGVIPGWIASHFKGPSLQFTKATTDSVLAELADDRKVYDEALATAAKAAVEFHRVAHAKHVAVATRLVDIELCKDTLYAKLSDYSTSIINVVGRGSATIWETYARAVTTAFLRELEDQRFEFTAALHNAAAEQTAKAAAVDAAREDAEMKDATKPIGELIDEKLNARLEVAVAKRVQEIQDAAEKAKKNSAVATSTNASAGPSTSSTKASEPAKKKKKKDSSDAPKEATSGGSGARGNAVEGRRSGSRNEGKDAKGKQKEVAKTD
ncbi:hypothetical protein EIP91_011477 [Steccherinum ochraceum]|uniref:Uncharacterized protein n=1 Tax=Steccherinum ochraceum TaxID=92696 RepID=A0A4R0R7G9_9APHY|nr:hypothetical protein EIP91_011477 [Steccherinum ochraceum]